MVVTYASPNRGQTYQTEIPCEADPMPFARQLIEAANVAAALPCDCFIPTLEGAGQHAPGCAIFKNDLNIDEELQYCRANGDPLV